MGYDFLLRCIGCVFDFRVAQRCSPRVHV